MSTSTDHPRTMHIQELRRCIIARAMTHGERRDLRARPGGTDAITLRQRLDGWCQAAAEGNFEKFARRLGWDGLTRESCEHLLVDVEIDETETLGSWARSAGEIIDLFSRPREPSFVARPADHTGGMPTPFEHALSPLRNLAVSRLRQRVPAIEELFSEPALNTCIRQFDDAVAWCGTPALHHVFSIYRAARSTGLFRAAAPRGSDMVYRDFTGHLLAGGMLEVLAAYPVLVRLFATVLEQWVDHTAELLERLRTDHQAISTTFNGREPLGKVTALLTGLSDRHHGGRSVAGLCFESGCCVLYKPRSLAIDVAFNQLASWLHAHGALRLRTARVIDRDAYGWVEYVHGGVPGSEQQLKRYYEHAGMLLCVAHVLGAMDLHAENVVSTAEFPVLVDLETLLHPRAREIQQGERSSVEVEAEDARIAASALATELLPLRDFGPAGTERDASGLGGHAPDPPGVSQPQWVHVNQDAMTFRPEAVEPRPAREFNAYRPSDHSIRLHADQVANGFRTAYCALLRYRDRLLGPDGPLRAFASLPVRFVFRPTRVYAQRLATSVDPRHLRDGAEWGTQFEVFARPVFLEPDPRPLWPLVRAELRALERLDVPLLVADTGRVSLDLGEEGTLDGIFEASSYADLLERVRRLGPHDLDFQLNLIRSALAVVRPPPKVVLPDSPPHLHLSDVLGREFLAVASAIGEELEHRAVRLGSHVAWLGRPASSHGGFQLGTTGRDLYEGSCGIGLLFAALFRLTGDARWRSLALRSVGWAREAEEGGSPVSAASGLPVGGAIGLGSVVYALARIGELIKDPSLLQPARACAEMLCRQVAGDTTYDVMSGSAGAVLGLLALHASTGEEWILDIAAKVARHLLQACPAIRAGSSGKDAKPANPGFAHGNAGIAYALIRLWDTTGDPELLQAANEAIRDEQVTLAAAGAFAGDGSRTEGPPFPVSSWCNGAAGIGLARLGVRHALDSAVISSDIEACLRIGEHAPLGNVDSMCCGNAGRLELLVAAGMMQQAPDLMHAARRYAIEMVNRAREQGGFRLGTPGRTPPGLFTGLAGVGYQLLRVAYPERLPSILLWR